MNHQGVQDNLKMVDENLEGEQMKALCQKKGNVTIVQLEGRLDYESSPHFRNFCFDKLATDPVIFDMKGLNFVGSVGLSDFVDTVQELYVKTPQTIKICGASNEFRKLFESRVGINWNFYDSSEKALGSLAGTAPLVFVKPD